MTATPERFSMADSSEELRLATLAEMIAEHAAKRPTTSAVICAGRSLDYRSLHQLSTCIAQALLGDGLVPGDRVAYLGVESVEYYATLVACAKAGLVLVPVNFRLTAPEVEHIVRDSGSALLLVDPGLEPVVEGLIPSGRGPRVRPTSPAAIDAWLAAPGRAGEPIASAPGDPVVQLYTSGTTGLPKGVVLTQCSLFTVRGLLADASLDWIDVRAGDVSLIGIPGTHVGGVWWSAQGFAAGATNVAMPRFDAGQAVELIDELGITTACVVPAMLRLLLDHPRATPVAFASLRKVVYGGSPIAASVLERAIPVLDCDFAQIYGLTETGNTAICLPPADHYPGSPRLRAAGRPYPGIDCAITDEDGTPLPTGRIGEVSLRTPARMLEYWRMPEATADTVRDGWVRTGDAGYLDEDGYLYIHDRIKDMILVGGENVYPTEIENVLASHSQVADVAVFGVPDDSFGERVHAVVVPRPGSGLRQRDLFTFCQERLAGFKVPARFELASDVPRNPSGKILRRELRQAHWRDRDRNVN